MFCLKDLEPLRHNNVALTKFVFEFEASMTTKEALVALSYHIDFLIINVIYWLRISNQENIFSNKGFSRFHEFKLEKSRFSLFNLNLRIDFITRFAKGIAFTMNEFNFVVLFHLLIRP